jgi:hypothetical protein
LPEHAISFFAPQRVVEDLLDLGKDFLNAHPGLKFDGFVEYKDSRSNTYSEKFTIDLNYHQDLSYLDTKKPGDELARLVGEARKLSMTAQAISRSLRQAKGGGGSTGSTGSTADKP